MKALGYLLSLIGLAGLALSQKSVQTAVSITPPESISNTTLLIGSGIILVVGLFVISRGSSESGNGKHSEVPIYHGNKIVGYRRV